MTSNELKLLCDEEKKLNHEEKWILETLNKIKTQKISLEVEQMQLMSMLKSHKSQKDIKGSTNDESSTSSVKKFEANDYNVELMDQEHSVVNSKQLDLSLMNEFDTILTGRNFSEVEISEESE